MIQMAFIKKEDIKKISEWGNSEEDLLATWADKAACYRWLHEKTEKRYSRRNMGFTIPVIVLSTLTGTANFGLGSIFPENMQGAAQLGIGGVSLLAGIITTVANFLQYAQGMEAHRGAGVSWGKLHRKISVELALPRQQRESCMEFLLVCRSEMDRLIEQSPTIPDEIIYEFEKTFPNIKLSKPEVCNHLEVTRIYAPKIIIESPSGSPKREVRFNNQIVTPSMRREVQEEVTRRRRLSNEERITTKDEVIQDLNELQESGIVSRMLKERSRSLRAVIVHDPNQPMSPEKRQIRIVQDEESVDKESVDKESVDKESVDYESVKNEEDIHEEEEKKTSSL